MYGPLILALAYLAVVGTSRAEIDADKAAELSREIREHFRQTGANWISPKMFLELNLTHNIKPIMIVYTSRSCADCRDFMAGWGKLDRVTLSSITAQFLSVLALDDYMFELQLPTGEMEDYLPRVLFADIDGKLLKDIKNPHADFEAPYFYTNANHVLEAMRIALQRHWEMMGTDVFQADLQADIL